MGRIIVDEDRCKGCEICVSACPKKVIAMADHFNRQGYRPARMAVARTRVPEPVPVPVPVPVGGGPPETDIIEKESTSVGECTGCTLCARMCPDVAITVYR